ncbi:MAG: hypothetical protein IKG21_09115 [Atopobiaceae bacterium]|nr:hypothetical protein [Atopobiaceae bacterium]
MTHRPWLDKHEAKAQGYVDARRVSSFVFGRTLLGEEVTEREVSILLANTRSRIDTMRNTRRPTKDERQRARLALEMLCANNSTLRKFVVFDDEPEDSTDAEA